MRKSRPRKSRPRLTRAFVTRTLKAMEVLLPENQEAQLNDLALRTGRGTDDLIQEAVARMLAHNAWFKEQVQIGIDQIARGEFIDEDEMDTRVKRMLES
jgi:predicted transcriptional regulator